MKFAIAVCILSGLVSCKSTNKAAYVSRANQLANRGRIDDAILNFRKALQADPNYGEALFGLGKVLQTSGNFVDAVATLERAHQLLPEREDVAIAYGNICIAGYLSDPDRLVSLHDRAMVISTKLLQKPKVSFEAYKLAAQLKLSEKKFPEALAFLRSADAVQPWRPEVMLSIVDLMLTSGQRTEAEKLGREAIQRNPQFAPLYELMHLHYRRVQLERDAEGILELRVRNNPKDAVPVQRLCEYYLNRQPPALPACVTRMIAAAPPSGDTEMAAGDLLRLGGDPVSALAHYEKGFQLGGAGRSAIMARTVELLVETGKSAEARARVDALLQKERKDPYWRRLKAELASSASPKEIQESIATLEELGTTFGKDPSYWQSLARAYEAKGDLPQAIKRLEKAASLDPGRKEPRLALGNLLAKLGRHQEALVRLREVRSIDPSDIRARLLESASAVGSGDFNMAEKLLAGVEKDKPGNVEVRIQTAYLRIAQGQTARAEQLFSGLLKDSKDSRVALGYAQLLASTNRSDAAVKVLQEAAKSNQDPEIAKFNAVLLVRMKRYDDAIRLYKDLLVRHPDSTELQVRLGEAYQASGNSDLAAATFTKAQQQGKNVDMAPSVGLAMALVSKGDHKSAIAMYRSILSRDPNNAIALNNLAYELAEHGGDLDEALRYASNATRAAPDVPDFMDTLGWIYLKKNLNASAVQTFAKVVSRAPQNATYRYHFGAALIADGANQKAVRELEEAKRLGPAAEEAKEIESLLRRARSQKS